MRVGANLPFLAKSLRLERPLPLIKGLRSDKREKDARLTARTAQNWNLKRVNVGPVVLERETPKLFLTSGTAILRHAVQDACRRLAQLNGIVFFLDDLQNLNTPRQHAVALTLRDQFPWFAIENINCSICFSASANYFSDIRSLAEPAVRFSDKVYLGPFVAGFPIANEP